MLRVGQSFFASLVLGGSIVAVVSGGCGGSKPNGLLGGDIDGGGDDDAGGATFGGGGAGGSSSGAFGDDGGQGPSCAGCVVNSNCPGGGHTSISGTVFDPAGKNPLNNVVVFAPRDVTQLPSIAVGTSTCNTCDTPIGDYYTAAVSDYKGHFSLSDIPTGKQVPFVAQSGKWRYVFYVDTADCANTDVPTASPGSREITWKATCRRWPCSRAAPTTSAAF